MVAMDWMKRCFGISAILVLGVLLFQGCKSEREVADPRAELEKVAEEYWSKRLIEKDYEFTYQLELDKESIPYEDYVQKVQRAARFQTLSVTLKEITIHEDRAEVLMSVETRAPFLPKQTAIGLKDLWILESGKWRHKFTD